MIVTKISDYVGFVVDEYGTTHVVISKLIGDTGSIELTEPAILIDPSEVDGFARAILSTKKILNEQRKDKKVGCRITNLRS